MPGEVRFYDRFEERPTHPLTGAPAEFYYAHWVVVDGKVVTTKYPRWGKDHRKTRGPENSWFSLPEVARMLGKSRRRIHQLVKEGAIPAKLIQAPGKRGVYYVNGQWIVDLARTRPDMGSLPKKMEESKR